MTGFPDSLVGKESAWNAGDPGSIPGLGRSPRDLHPSQDEDYPDGKGYLFQYSGLENSTDCIVLGVAKSQTQLSNFHFLSTCDKVLLGTQEIRQGFPSCTNKCQTSGCLFPHSLRQRCEGGLEGSPSLNPVTWSWAIYSFLHRTSQRFLNKMYSWFSHFVRVLDRFSASKISSIHLPINYSYLEKKGGES